MGVFGGRRAAGAAAAVADAANADAGVPDLEESAGQAEVVGCRLDLGYVDDFGSGGALVFDLDFEVEWRDAG